MDSGESLAQNSKTRRPEFKEKENAESSKKDHQANQLLDDGNWSSHMTDLCASASGALHGVPSANLALFGRGRTGETKEFRLAGQVRLRRQDYRRPPRSRRLRTHTGCPPGGVEG